MCPLWNARPGIASDQRYRSPPGGMASKHQRNVPGRRWCGCPSTAHSEPRTRRRGSMADVSIRNLGIGLASSILAGAISVTAAAGVAASGPGSTAQGSYVYTESNQTSANGGNAVLAYWVA